MSATSRYFHAKLALYLLVAIGAAAYLAILSREFPVRSVSGLAISLAATVLLLVWAVAAAVVYIMCTASSTVWFLNRTFWLSEVALNSALLFFFHSALMYLTALVAQIEREKGLFVFMVIAGWIASLGLIALISVVVISRTTDYDSDVWDEEQGRKDLPTTVSAHAVPSRVESLPGSVNGSGNPGTSPVVHPAVAVAPPTLQYTAPPVMGVSGDLEQPSR